jgi:hypothetical protein
MKSLFKNNLNRSAESMIELRRNNEGTIGGGGGGPFGPHSRVDSMTRISNNQIRALSNIDVTGGGGAGLQGPGSPLNVMDSLITLGRQRTNNN